MWDKIGYLLSIVGFCFVIYKAYKFLEQDGFFINKDVKNHFLCMTRILSPYSSIEATKDLQIRYNKAINQIAKYAKTEKVGKEFIEKSKHDSGNGAFIFPLIYVLHSYSRAALRSDEEKVAVNALFSYCKKELLKYKDYAPKVFWEILYLDKESFYKDIVEKN